MDLKIVDEFLSLKIGMVWENIPEFSVVTGKNGGGKTHLLSCIDGRIEQRQWIYNCDYKANQRVFIRYDWKPLVNTPQKDLLENTKNQTNEFVNCWNKGDPNSNHHYYFVMKEFLARSVGQEIDEQYIRDNCPSDLQYQIESMDGFRGYFLSWLRNRQKRIEKAVVVEKDFDKVKRISEEKSPWDMINELFEANGFHYKMIQPDPDNNAVAIMFRHTKTNKPCNISELSSGEKMIVSLVMWAHNTNTGNRVKLLLLDEPDAHLHPSMSKMMINIIQNTLVKEYGIRVIMTTHSPSTVAHAMAKNVDIVWMENGQIITNKDRGEILDGLSSGLITYNNIADDFQLLINESKTNILFTEGKTDKIYLETAIDVFDMRKDFEEKRIFIFACTGADNIKIFADNKKSLPIKKSRVALLDQDNKGREVSLELDRLQKVKCIYVSENEGEIERLFDDSLLLENKVLIDGKITKEEEKKLFANKMRDLLIDEEKKKIFKNFEKLLRDILSAFDEEMKAEVQN